MTVGVGGSTFDKELSALQNMTQDMHPITLEQYQSRLEKAIPLMEQERLDAVYLNAGTNLSYFTGTVWHPSERLVGAVLLRTGQLLFIAPHFEKETLLEYQQIAAPIYTWHEHESPYQLVNSVLQEYGISTARIGVDESTPFFIADGLRLANENNAWVSAKAVTAGCRMQKSPEEIGLLQRAKDMTLVVQRSVARILYEGISTQEVTDFIHQAHKKVGALRGSYFCIVLFGKDSAYPHGVKSPNALQMNDMVLIDTGCQLHGYNSDITRSYVFGEPNERQKTVWNAEKIAQQKGFDAAILGAPCADVDAAAREYLATQGFGPKYALPGLPHRTGHGIGLDIHEWPYLVGGDNTPLNVGMCFSNEPAICIPGEFGVRLEDHFYMSEKGPRWFTQPSHSIDDPFGYALSK